ncbi:hypothetical protein DPMN_147607 [Dreissena polymorpha]|uniref:Uncharacterized protein n=1 Tax=Dreissena polymorpha TaxID=45954 RepID=A0A9D4IZG6_DREPO|nr:hypothetical protein DPMN_147607 [Dreissena polymorpha]
MLANQDSIAIRGLAVGNTRVDLKNSISDAQLKGPAQIGRYVRAGSVVGSPFVLMKGRVMESVRRLTVLDPFVDRATNA